MIPTQHPSNNDVLLPPPGATNDECRPLAITRAVTPDGAPWVVSYWRPDPEELALLAAGASVRFSCWGRTHPPIYLGVDGDGPL